MTILGAKNQLVTHFLTHDTFDPVKHAFEVIYDKDTADFREELVQAALDELERAGFVKKLNQPEKQRTIWVLVQPIHSFVQQVSFGPLVSSIIADCVNAYNGAEGIKSLCDKTKIEEQDILRLIGIISNWESQVLGDDEDEPAPAEEERS